MKNLKPKAQERFSQELKIKSYFKGWQTGWLTYDEWSEASTAAPEFMRAICSGIEARARLIIEQKETKLDPSIKATARALLELLAKLVGGGEPTDMIKLGALMQKVDTQLVATGALEVMLKLKQLQPAIERGERNQEASSKGGEVKNKPYADMREHYQPLIDQFHQANPTKSYEWLKKRVQRELKEKHNFDISVDTIKKYTKNPRTNT